MQFHPRKTRIVNIGNKKMDVLPDDLRWGSRQCIRGEGLAGKRDHV
jgi:hypothetical protein